MPRAKLAIELNADALSFFVPQIGKPVLNNNAKCQIKRSSLGGAGRRPCSQKWCKISGKRRQTVATGQFSHKISK